MAEIFLIRHGETDWNALGKIQGHTDIALNPNGHKQAACLGAYFKAVELAAVYTSDLIRTRETAAYIAAATQTPLLFHSDLRERSLGLFEGHTHAEIQRLWPQEATEWQTRNPLFTPPQGESLKIFFERATRCLQNLAQQHLHKKIALVTHGGVLDCWYRYINQLDLQSARKWEITNASINQISYSPPTFKVTQWAYNEHLKAVQFLDESSDGYIVRSI